MNPSRYNYEAQQAVFQALHLATSMGHGQVEPPHVAVFLAKHHKAPLTDEVHAEFDQTMRAKLRRLSKSYKGRKPRMSAQLKELLSELETSTEGEVTPEILWRAVLQEQSQGAGQGREGKQRKSKEAGSSEQEGKSDDDKPSKVLEEHTVDLTELAMNGSIDPVIGRSEELRRVLETLGRKRKNNPILLGEAGVGKTAVVEALALAIATGDVPGELEDRRILSLDLASLLAGSKFRGEFEERLKKLVEALKELDGKVLLFIDEAHTIVGAGGSEGSGDAANLIKPALARGELHVIAATTLAEYKKHIEKDPALERRFQPVLVEEPDQETCVAMLRGIKSRFELFHGVRIDDDALEAAVRLSVRYLNDRRLPDKAIDLIDEAASRLKLETQSMPRVMAEALAKAEQLEMELAHLGQAHRSGPKRKTLESSLATARAEYESYKQVVTEYREALSRLEDLVAEEVELRYLASRAEEHEGEDFARRARSTKLPELADRIHAARQVLHRFQVEHEFLKRGIGVHEIAQVLSDWAGMPVGTVLEEGKEHLADLHGTLGTRVFGQDRAVQVMVRLIRRAKVGLGDPQRPAGVSLFLGPSGVGKTELAKAVAEQLFGSSDRMIRFDMSEFNQPHQVARLIGPPPGYVGYGDGGELTEAIRRKPNSVVLLDEIEKGHPKAWDILLQVFDEGRLTDSDGRHIDCRSCLFVMTSNLLATTDAFDPVPGESPEDAEARVRSALTDHLRPEFVNRIQDVVPFFNLGAEDLQRVLELLVSSLNDQLSEKELTVVLDAPLRKALVDAGLYEAMGARSLQRQFDRKVRDVLVDHLFDHDESPGTLVLALSGERVVVRRAGDDASFDSGRQQAA